eukprot:scaffold7438_cov130-Isochrysis_galbana.AAC.1
MRVRTRRTAPHTLRRCALWAATHLYPSARPTEEHRSLCDEAAISRRDRNLAGELHQLLARLGHTTAQGHQVRVHVGGQLTRDGRARRRRTSRTVIGARARRAVHGTRARWARERNDMRIGLLTLHLATLLAQLHGAGRPDHNRAHRPARRRGGPAHVISRGAAAHRPVHAALLGCRTQRLRHPRRPHRTLDNDRLALAGRHMRLMMRRRPRLHVERSTVHTDR